MLEQLQRDMPMGLWMVTRVEGDDWILLATADRGYDVGDGTVLRWSDSFCSRMVEGHGPRVAPTGSADPAYTDAPIGAALPIGSYVGVPLVDGEGHLFGTLCAIDPEPADPGIGQRLPQVELMARLLGSVLAADLRADAEQRRAERAETEAQTDGLTGVGNRRGWDTVLAAEERRCSRFGDAAAVVVIDLDGLKTVNDRDGHLAGDRLILATADVLKRSVTPEDYVARIGGDEFALLLAGADARRAESVSAAITRALTTAGIAAATGVAVRDHAGTLLDAFRLADERMYAVKRAARAAG